MEIGHTQERLTVVHKWVPGEGSASGNGQKHNKVVAIPLVNKGAGVVFTARLVVGKGEESLAIDNEELGILDITSVKRLQIDSAPLIT